MPSILFYADSADFEMLRHWINESSELAYIVGDGPGRWRAVAAADRFDGNRICLWHVPSGPLPLLHPPPSDKVEWVTDPWSGWRELRAEAGGGRNPYFGPGHVGIIWLNRRPEPARAPGTVGMSGIEWIGNHYAIIGSPAQPTTEKLWKRLRGWITKQSERVPRSGPLGGGGEIFALPSALAKIRAGVPRDNNPSP